METQLRATLIAHLAADAGIAAAINLVDEAEIERASAPWLALVASASIDWGTKTHAGREVRVAFELRLHGDDPATGGETAERIDARILSLPAGQDGFRVVSAAFLRGRAERRPRNARALLREYRFRLLAA
ncbi:tail completion protein gp17 [Alteriqipengyuania sp. 357]